MSVHRALFFSDKLVINYRSQLTKILKLTSKVVPLFLRENLETEKGMHKAPLAVFLVLTVCMSSWW